MKSVEQLCEGYYSPYKSISYGRKAIFSVGTRSCGKSTGWPMLLIDEWLKYKQRFVYVRRRKPELQKSAGSFTRNAELIMNREGYDIPPITHRGGMYYMDGEVIGYSVPLSIQSSFKSVPFDNVRTLFYDEFMAGRGGSRYLGSAAHPMAECEALEMLCQTIDRDVDSPFAERLRIVMVGNADTFYNPFFMLHGVDRYVKPETRYCAPKDECWVYENTDNVPMTAHYAETQLYAFCKATRGYAYSNEFSDNMGSLFIDKEPPGERFAMFNFRYCGELYGVYRYSRKGFIYIDDRGIEGRQTFDLTTDDHRPNHLLIRQWHNNEATSLIKEMYDKGAIRFRNRRAKNMLDYYLKYDII